MIPFKLQQHLLDEVRQLAIANKYNDLLLLVAVQEWKEVDKPVLDRRFYIVLLNLFWDTCKHFIYFLFSLATRLG